MSLRYRVALGVLLLVAILACGVVGSEDEQDGTNGQGSTGHHNGMNNTGQNNGMNNKGSYNGNYNAGDYNGNDNEGSYNGNNNGGSYNGNNNKGTGRNGNNNGGGNNGGSSDVDWESYMPDLDFDDDDDDDGWGDWGGDFNFGFDDDSEEEDDDWRQILPDGMRQPTPDANGVFSAQSVSSSSSSSAAGSENKNKIMGCLTSKQTVSLSCLGDDTISDASVRYGAIAGCDYTIDADECAYQTSASMQNWVDRECVGKQSCSFIPYSVSDMPADDLSYGQSNTGCGTFNRDDITTVRIEYECSYERGEESSVVVESTPESIVEVSEPTTARVIPTNPTTTTTPAPTTTPVPTTTPAPTPSTTTTTTEPTTTSRPATAEPTRLVPGVPESVSTTSEVVYTTTTPDTTTTRTTTTYSVPESTNPSPSSTTSPEEKEGQCPADLYQNSFSYYRPFWCLTMCNSDSSCPGNLKCCGDCLKMCTEPVLELKPKTGECPRYYARRSSRRYCFKIFPDQCKVDNDCPSDMLCCGDCRKKCLHPAGSNDRIWQRRGNNHWSGSYHSLFSMPTLW